MRRLALAPLLVLLAASSWGQASQEFFDASELITIGDVNEVDGVDNLTVGVWFWTDTVAGGASNLRNISDKNNNGYILRLGTAADVLSFFIGTTNSAVTSTVIQVNRWYCVVGTYDRADAGARIKLYLDGVLEGTHVHSDIATPSTANLVHIGAPTAVPTRDWDGKLAHFFLHGGVTWSAQQIADFCEGNVSLAQRATTYHPFWYATTFPDVAGSYDGTCSTCPTASGDGPPVFIPGGGND